MKTCLATILSLILSMPAWAEPVQLNVDFAKPDGRWDLPRYALGQGGLPKRPDARTPREGTSPASSPHHPALLSEFSEWNMDLMQPNLSPGFQPAFVLETVRRFAEAGLDMAAYYHVRDCFVDEAEFDWMSPGGRNFMAHWWNTMPQYSALFDHHGRVRPPGTHSATGAVRRPAFLRDGRAGKHPRDCLPARTTAGTCSCGAMKPAGPRKSTCG